MHRDRISTWILVSIISYGFMAIPILIAIRIRDLLNSSFKIILIIGAAGALRGLAILQTSKILSLPVAQPEILRVFNSAVSVPLWFMAIHLFFETREYQRTRFLELYFTAVKLEKEKLFSKTNMEIDQVTVEIENRIQKATSNLKDELKNSSKSDPNFENLIFQANLIKNFSDDEIRDLSHELFHSNKLKPLKFSYKMILQHALLKSKLPFALVIVPVLVYELIGLTTVFGFNEATRLVTFIGIGYVLVAIVNELRYLRLGFSSTRFNFAVLAISLALPFFAVFQSNLFPELGIKYRIAIIMCSIFYLFLLVAFAIHQSTALYVEDVENFMVNQINKEIAQVREYSSHDLRREFGSYLHGYVRSQLIAASMQLRNAALLKDNYLKQTATDQVEQILSRDHRDFVMSGLLPMRTKIERLRASWEGIATIDLEIEPLGNFEEEILEDALEIFQELISNSIRHGEAKEILFTLKIASNIPVIVMIDDGLPIKWGKRGLGSKILESAVESIKSSRVDGKNLSECKLRKRHYA